MQLAAITSSAEIQSDVGALSTPAAGSPTDREHGEPDDDDGCAGDVTARDRLVGQQVAERQSPHDRGHEQRLDDRDAAAVERSGLQRHAETLRRQAEQPDAVRQQPDEPAGIAGSDTRIHRGALPQGRREGEREGGERVRGPLQPHSPGRDPT